jgi:hypothetical protein
VYLVSNVSKCFYSVNICLKWKATTWPQVEIYFIRWKIRDRLEGKCRHLQKSTQRLYDWNMSTRRRREWAVLNQMFDRFTVKRCRKKGWRKMVKMSLRHAESKHTNYLQLRDEITIERDSKYGHNQEFRLWAFLLRWFSCNIAM